MENNYRLEKINNKWEYDNYFIEWLKNNSYKFTGTSVLSKFLKMDNRALIKIILKNNLNLKYKINKLSPNFKSIYQDYNWCFKNYIIERKTYDEMANIANCSKRVIQKWCSEKYNLNRHTQKNKIKISEVQRRLITISRLGDGHIDKRENQPMFIVSHAENQKEYLYWKYNILKNLCNKAPIKKEKYYSLFNGKNYLCQPMYRFNTKIINDLKSIRALSKIQIISQMKEFELSIYMLDDGCREKSEWSLCVAKFNQEEKNFFIEICKTKFNLDCKIGKFDNRYIYFNSQSSKKIDSIILSQIPNELDVIQYKIIKTNGVK